MHTDLATTTAYDHNGVKMVFHFTNAFQLRRDGLNGGVALQGGFEKKGVEMIAFRMSVQQRHEVRVSFTISLRNNCEAFRK